MSPATPSPLAGYADKIVYLADHQLAVVTADDRPRGRIASRVTSSISVETALDVDDSRAGLGASRTYMLKEIFEQPESLENAMRGRLSDEDATAVFGGLNLTPQRTADASAASS